jgi:cytochrome b subunit of formate dehydrogenase
MDQELASLETTGGTRRVHVLVAMCYRIAGRTGVMIFFGGTCLVASMFAIKAFRNARLAKIQLAEAQQVYHNGK